MPVNLVSSSLPVTLSGLVSVGQFGVPRFWATIWSDVVKTTLRLSTRRRHLAALERFYEAVQRQRGSDCLDRLIAEADADALEDCLVGFLAQLRNEAAVTNVDKTSTWTSAVSFVSDMLRFSGNSGARAPEMEARLLRLDVLYRQLAPNPESTEGPVIRALPSTVVQDLYEVFRPDSARNPFKTETLRWRNLVIFMLLLRLGLRRGEAALLYVGSFKEDFNYDTGEMDHWLDVEETHDGDPRYEQPSLKTAPSRRQLPLSKELVELIPIYSQNFRGKAHYPHLLISQKSTPLSLRSMNEIFEVASKALSPEAKKSLSVDYAEHEGASALVNEFVARAYPYRQEPNRNYARIAFSIAACDEDHHSEDDFERKENALLGRGAAEPLVGLPLFRKPRKDAA